MTKTTHIRAIASVAAMLAAGSAAADTASAMSYDGYFRAGPGATSKNAARSCYNLGVSGGHYRLGNECDFYGEFGLTQVGSAGGVDYKARLMFNEYNPGTDVGRSSSSFEQMYVEGKGFDISPNTNFWIGKRFYGRADVHILDTFFVRMDGVGAGADNIELGAGKLGIAYFKADTGVGFGDPGNGASTNPGNRFNIDYSDLPVNPGGTLRVTATFTRGQFDNAINGVGTNGVALSLQHGQAIASLGGKNTLWFQYAKGSAGLDGNFGNMTAQSSVKKWRLVESVAWQLGRFGGQAVALGGHQDRDNVSGAAAYKESSVGGRVSYAFTQNFKLLAEIGHMEKRPDGSPTQQLTKLTIAPTLSTGPGFWNRPELRLYVTTAKWNKAANDAAGPAGLTGAANDKTRGTSVGAQAEIWF